MQRTEGNPFFAEESVRSLVEAGVLVGEKGAYRPGLRIDEIRIPSTVQNVVADRIDRLPMEEKRVLQTAAVIGVIVPFSLLQAVAEVAGRRAAASSLRICRPPNFSMKQTCSPSWSIRSSMLLPVKWLTGSCFALEESPFIRKFSKRSRKRQATMTRTISKRWLTMPFVARAGTRRSATQERPGRKPCRTRLCERRDPGTSRHSRR